MSNTENSSLANAKFSKKVISSSVASGVALAGGAGTVVAQDSSFALEEVVVTARQRTESTQDVPMHIQAISGDQMKKRGLTTLEDFSRFVPSVSIASTTPGQNTVTFRGVSDGGGFLVDPTAAVYLDEQPLTLTSQAPDIYPADIARVEALAGPQSTLYGASSQSGTIRIITNKPDVSEFAGFIGLGIDSTKSGSVGHDLEAMVNIPLIEDKLAIRLVGFTATDGGFIDNVLGNTVTDPFGSGLGGLQNNAAQVKDDINQVDWQGFRASAKWDINDNVSATLSGNYQKIEADGWNDHDPTVGDLQVVKFIEETRDDEWSQISLIIEADLGFAQLVSASSYFDREVFYQTDTQSYAAYFHYALGIYAGYATYNLGVDPIGGQTNDQQNDRFTQEIRLSASTDTISWTAGLFYQEADERWDFISFLDGYRDSPAFAAWSGYYPDIAPTDGWWLSTQISTRTDKAVFGELDWSLTDKLDLLLGGRWYDVEVDRDYFVSRPTTRLEQQLQAGGTDDGFVPKVGLQYNATDDMMLWVLYSEGYRVGGINRGRGEPTLPVEYNSDTLENLEIGIKSTWMDGRLQLNLTAYQMDWKDVQLEATDPSFEIGEPFQVVIANLGNAEVRGFDFDMNWAVTENILFGFNITHIIDAEVEAPAFFPDARFEGGQASLGLDPVSRLPLFADTNWSAFFEYSDEVSWFNGGEYYVRLQHNDEDESFNQLSNSDNAPKASQGNYSVTDVKIGFKADKWNAQLYVNNLSDDRGITFNDSSDFDPFFGRASENIIRPRNFGVKVGYNF
ncbi:MAG: TonB-dependent receptor [Pseudomonadales bacterium]